MCCPTSSATICVIATEVAGENELWLAIVMLELANKEDLGQEQIAAVLSATLDERMRENAYVGCAADTRNETCARKKKESGLASPNHTANLSRFVLGWIENEPPEHCQRQY